ncbi:hypothetical protein MCUN1_003613 [Malassezia cuniculi]|uniref:Ribosomal RNA-processing protein 17 n=1 Tax=Malassezia cuniculi TaxID=948313 RepID=A0AAF0ETR8_9BASI|nr:hypothetical protein MCUN1_003613 [Malassezia cuniculi]
MSAPLQAYTESAQKSLRPKREQRKEHARKIKAGKKIKLEFDDAARHEYLTGFSKRKQARKQAAHDFVQAKIREELRESRRAAREARKEKAAENVAAEKAFYARDDDDDDDEDDDDGEQAPIADVAPLSTEHEFETDDRRALVTVQSFDMDDPMPVVEAAPTKEKTKTVPKSAKETAKRAVPTTKTKLSAPSGSLTGILEPEVALAAQSGQLFDDDDIPKEAPTKKEKFTYTTAAERAAERQRIRRKNHKHAEKRRAENKARAMQKNRGSGKRR